MAKPNRNEMMKAKVDEANLVHVSHTEMPKAQQREFINGIMANGILADPLVLCSQMGIDFGTYWDTLNNNPDFKRQVEAVVGLAQHQLRFQLLTSASALASHIDSPKAVKAALDTYVAMVKLGSGGNAKQGSNVEIEVEAKRHEDVVNEGSFDSMMSSFEANDEGQEDEDWEDEPEEGSSEEDNWGVAGGKASG